MKSFRHYTVHSVDEAVALLQSGDGRMKMIAGGTDLLGVLKGDILSDYPEAVINIKNLAGMDRIEEIGGGCLRIGPLARLADIVRSPLIREKAPVLSEAAETVATPEIRNMATIGGNLCQDVRCWYYRFPQSIGGRINCLRKDGKGTCPAVRGDNRYHAVMGGKGCFAVCPSDMAVALAALDGVVTLAGAKGKREVPVREFYTSLRTVMTSDEIVTEITAKIPERGARQSFRKFTLRKPIDFAIVSVASVITQEGGVCRDAKLAIGGVSHVPVRAIEAERTVEGKRLDETTAAAAAEAAMKDSRPLSKNTYKIEIAKTMIRRCLMGFQPL
jgi:xanthine dehydrogenase YagS FAD-binding subunit